MKIGFIGTGVMAGAIMSGIIKNGVCEPENIIGADLFEASRKNVENLYGIKTTADNCEVASSVDVLFLAVKPQVADKAIASFKDAVKENTIVISIAAGKQVAWLEEQFGRELKIIRVMPNTPALVGEGMTAACPNKNVSDEDLELALKVLGSFGKVDVVPEYLMDTVTGVSGSGPAYVFMFIEALADGAVCMGMPRAQSYKFAAQTVLGAAKMVLETGKHPGELKDMVCSPAGTTIAAVRVLEDHGLRSTMIEAVEKCTETSRSLA